ncbi:Uncharacterized protein GBIM_12681 [Gryllus bimaculatus]|nr:Uncharacterized protein GBIM_12681 [Gryllus bimaculatus]
MSTNDETDIIFLQPHLLTKASLIHVLEQKCMNLKHLQVMRKDNLVELFQRIALPLPQRKYRQNRRGKLMTKLQKKREGHMKKPQETHSGVSIGFGEASSAQPRVGLGIGDRLKPPPDAVNFERRKIRLTSGSNKSSDLDHIQIKRRKSDSENGLIEDDKQGTNREHKTNTSPSVEEKPNGTAKVILKRSLSASMKLNDTSGQEPEKKKEKKLITWP